jgi:hypothetical protein
MTDIGELAKELADHITKEASENWPGATLLQVDDGQGQWTDGYVWCSLGGSRIRCIVPTTLDLSGGSQVIYGIPLGSGPSCDYICIGVAWNGQDNSRIPRTRVAAITDINGNSIGGGGSGPVTSVGLSAAPASIFNVGGSPITTSGTLALSMDNQNANIVLAGPSSGGAAAPDFRSLVAGDIPDVSATYVTKALYDANTVLAATSDNTPAAVTIAEDRILGRKAGGNIDDLTAAEVTAILGISGSEATVDVEGTAGETLAELDIVYIDPTTGKWKKADIDTSPPLLSSFRGFVEESGGIANNDVGTIRVRGVLDGFTSLTAGTNVYATTTAGAYTQTRPTVTAGGVQKAIVLMGVAISATEVLILPAYVEYLKRASLTNNSTLTLLHHTDASGRTRCALATISTTVAGTAVAEYAETNKDCGVPLRGPAGAGATTTITATGGGSQWVGDGGGTDYAVSQGFQVTAGILSQITIVFDANTGSPSGTATWEIQTDNAGVPSNTVLATDTFTPVASTTNTINISDSIFLAASTTYHLVVKPTALQATNTRWNILASSSSVYAGGVSSWSVSPFTSWTAVATTDLDCTITTSAVTVRDKLSQSYQVTGSQTVASVKLWMRKWGTPTGTMTLRVETNNAGDPSGNLADANATVDLAESGLTTTYGWITFTFATAFSISGSTTYHIVLSTDRAASNTNYLTLGADASSPSYASGDMRSYASSTWSAETKDACFNVIGMDTVYDEPCALGRWSGGTRDVAIRYDDGAAADADTKTTAKNVTGSTIDMTLIVRLP